MTEQLLAQNTAPVSNAPVEATAPVATAPSFDINSFFPRILEKTLILIDTPKIYLKI